MEVDIIGVPADLGANRRGVDMGPSAIRYAGLKKSITKLGIQCNDLGNINVPVPENYDEAVGTTMKYIHEITSVNRDLCGLVRESLEKEHFPIVLGGDHSIAVGTIMGTQSVLKDIGVIWVDAHGDYNTEKTTLSGNLHGMPLAACTGAGALEMTSFLKDQFSYVNPEKVALIGVRSLDAEEARLLKKSGISVFTIEDIDMHGMTNIMKKALEIVTASTEGFHLSYDLDAISPNEAPGVGTPVKGGLTYREAHLVAEMVFDSGCMRSAEFVEVNPILDNMNQTGELAVSLICSALGQKIFRFR